MTEAIKTGLQFPLDGEFQSFTSTADVDEEKGLKKKRGLLLRILRPWTDGQLLDNITIIELGFKAGSARLFRYPYSTRTGRKSVDATPEDIRAVIAMRHQPRYRAAIR